MAAETRAPGISRRDGLPRHSSPREMLPEASLYAQLCISCPWRDHQASREYNLSAGGETAHSYTATATFFSWFCPFISSNELLVILGTTERRSMGKFFDHFCPDRAVGFGHPYSDRRPETWHHPLGYRGSDLDVYARSRCGRWVSIPGSPNCRSFIARGSKP